MKKILTTLFFATFLTTGFAQGQSQIGNGIENGKITTQLTSQERNGTIYLKICAEETQFIPNSDEQIMPGIGLGYRAAYGHHAADFSTDTNSREIRDSKGKKVTNFSYTFPRANYLYYLSPQNKGSFYAGGGLAFGGMKQLEVLPAQNEYTNEKGTLVPAQAASNKVQKFYGIVANGTVGYEFARLSKGAKTFIQLDVNQPTLAVSRSGDFFGPKVSLSVGVGF